MEYVYPDGLNDLDEYDRVQYSEKTHLQGCRLIFDTPVYQRRNLKHSPQPGGPGTNDQCNVEAHQNLLKKVITFPEVEKAMHFFREWATEKLRLSLSESDTLALDLNLSMTETPPKMLMSQLLCLAEGKPPVLCSFVDSRKVESRATEREIKAVKTYTIHMAQQLKTSLANFCTCDFAILRFVMEINNINKGTLQEAVKNELQFTRKFFRGTVDLTARSYTAIKKAVEALVSGSHIPCLLQEEKPDQVCILLLDKPWSDGLSLMIEALNKGGIKYPPDAPFKVKVAALEAATRHSYTTRVVICTPDKDIQDIARRIQEQADKDFHPKPDLLVEHTAADEDEKHWTTIYRSPEAERTVEVTVTAAVPLKDDIFLDYFESPRNGGGEVERVSIDDKERVVRLIFRKREVAERVAGRQHMLMSGPMTVKLMTSEEETGGCGRDVPQPVQIGISSDNEPPSTVPNYRGAFSKLISHGGLFILGPPHTGKSNLGRTLLQHCAERFYTPMVMHTQIELDRFVEKNEKQEQIVIFFDDLELEDSAVLLRFMNRLSLKPLIIISLPTLMTSKILEQFGFPVLYTEVSGRQASEAGSSKRGLRRSFSTMTGNVHELPRTKWIRNSFHPKRYSALEKSLHNN